MLAGTAVFVGTNPVGQHQLLRGNFEPRIDRLSGTGFFPLAQAWHQSGKVYAR
jgi:hypothetical protein